MSEPLTREDVVHVAHLARLQLTDGELEKFTAQLGAILAHAQDVAALDLSNVEPMTHPIPNVNVLRKDEVTVSLSRDEVLAQAPSAESGRFRVPPILGEQP